MKTAQDLTGQRFGKLVVIERSGTKGHNTMWLCRCDCGNTSIVSRGNLLNGQTKSCGCNKHKPAVNKTHGQSKTRLYFVWRNMLNRCYNANVPDFPNYGGRGISVCTEWQKDFQAFQQWAMDNGYDGSAKRGEFTIERIDPNGNYEPSNCKWANEIQQANNKRSNHYIEYLGNTITLKQASETSGIPYKTLFKRVNELGWDIEKAMTTKVRHTAKAGE